MNRRLYPIREHTRRMAQILGIDMARVLKRAGLSPELVFDGKIRVTAPQYFAICDAMFTEADRIDLPLYLGQTLAGAPFEPAILAFTCSPDIEIGLGRLAVFKPLVAPIRLTVGRGRETVELSIESSEADAPMPASFALFDLVYFVECARRYTARHIVPVDIEMPGQAMDMPGLEAFFGMSPRPGRATRLVLSLEDAKRPLISENAEFWERMEIDLKRQLAESEERLPVADRVRSVLMDLLPVGTTSADVVCGRLGMSKRSLQRRLSHEGETYQGILDAMRSELSMKYLTRSDMSVEEISYLLAYRDPNSFYRAFHGWTGMTPTEARGMQTH